MTEEVRSLPAPLRAGAAVKAIVPQSFEDVYRISKMVVASGMAPSGINTAEKAAVIIMHGAEVGLTPMMSLQRIALVNNRPTIWGDGAIGLVRASGLCGYVKEWIEGDGDARIAYCETLRKGETDPVVRRYSVADAKLAALWTKVGPWKQSPERMLQMRARGFCLRDVYADVLGGLYLREEMEDDFDKASEAPRPPAPVEQQTSVSPSIVAQIEHRPPVPMEVIEDVQADPVEQVEWTEYGEVKVTL